VQVTAQGLIRLAFTTLNVFQPAQSIPPDQSNLALMYLNMLMGLWAQQSFTVPCVSRETFTLTVGKGGPSNPYTIGSGANLNTEAPPNQAALYGAGILLPSNAGAPRVEVPRDVLTDSAYQAISIKEMPNSMFTGVYYNPTFVTSGFGTVNLWPVPNTVVNDLVLYMRKALTNFADLTTIYQVPVGYDKAIHDQLVIDLSTPWGAELTEGMIQAQLHSFKVITRNNLKMYDMANDFVNAPGGGYNIETGNY
jgi:hypothetical protein